MSNTLTTQITGLLGSVLPGLDGRGAWLARLRQASFRGVPFMFESAAGTYGRRYVMHQYPGRDTPYAEDLGRNQRGWTFAAYVIGGDYLDQRAALLAACEAPGPGALVLPLIGTVQAVCSSVDFADQRAQGGYSALSLTFAEAGQAVVPNPAEDTEAKIETSADTLSSTEQSSFLSSFGVSGANADVARAASTDVTSLGSMLDALRMPTYGVSQSGLVQAITTLTENADSLVENPSALYDQIDKTFAAFTDGSSADAGFGAMLTVASRFVAHGLPGFAGENEAQHAADGGAPLSASAARLSATMPPRAARPSSAAARPSSNAARTPARAALSSSAAARPSSATARSSGRASVGTVYAPVTPPQTAAQDAEVSNAVAFQSLARRLALREIAYNVPAIDLDNTEHAEDVRAQVVAAFQAESDAAAAAYDDDVFAALIDLEYRVVADIDLRAAQLPSLTTYNTQRSFNAIVLAYRLYADPERNLDIVARTGAINPAFMPLQGRVLDQ